MVRKHISREHSSHRKDKFRPIDEFYKVEIFSFEHDLTQIYLAHYSTLNGTNVTKKTWKSWTTYVVKDTKKKATLKCNYNVKEEGEYRIDVIYETFTKEDLTGKLLNNKLKFEGSVNHVKRKEIFTNFEVGNKSITLELPKNVYLYGIIVRKVKEFTGDSLDGIGTNLLLKKVSTTSSSQIAPSECSFEIGYDNALEHPATSTGLYLDYNDEINVYVKGATDKLEKQIFGGYLSTVQKDKSNTTLTVSCADRLIDGQNKFILTQMHLLGGATLPSESAYTSSMDIDFDTYGEALKYLCNCLEISLNNNVGKNDLVTGETAKKGFNIEFGKKKKISKVTTNNATSAVSKNFITIRNEPSAAKQQEIILYNAKEHRNSPVDITNYPHFGIVYGIGDPETSHDEKVTTKTSTGSSSAQKFNKCGVSQDGKYVMGVGLPSAGGESSQYGYTWYKAVYQRKCPFCGSTNVVYDVLFGDSSGAGRSSCNDNKYESGGGVEGHFFCKSCDGDWSVFGKPHGGKSDHMHRVSPLVKSSKAEAQQLKAGKLSVVPKTATAQTGEDILKAISQEAFSKFTYKLDGTTYSTASGLVKHGYGDCWAFSEWIFNQLKKRKVNCKVVEYTTSYSDRHRSVMYKNAKNQWVDFPYRSYGWASKYNNMLNNTNGSKHPKSTPFKYTGGGTIEQATGGGKTSTTTQTVHVTEGYSKDKPIQGYFAVTVSIEKSFKAKTQTVLVGFTQKAGTTKSITGFNPIWINNTVKKLNMDLLDFIKKGIYQDNTDKNKYYLHSIKFIAPVNRVVDSERSNREKKTVYKIEDWYTYDKSTHDNSSCKMDIYSLNFNDATLILPTDLDSCGKNVNSLFEDILKASKYTARKKYGKHRCDDRIDFSVDNQTEPKFIATEGDENNILEISGTSYTPRSNLLNCSTVVFKDSTQKYKYVETRSPESIMKYGEQMSLITSNEIIGSKEAYYMALNNEKYNPVETFNFTVTLPFFVNVDVGDLFQVIANMRKLNTIKTVTSVKYECTNSQIPNIQTEIGLGELPMDLQIQKELRDIRKMAKKETTHFTGSAEPITDDIYVWDS